MSDPLDQLILEGAIVGAVGMLMFCMAVNAIVRACRPMTPREKCRRRKR